MPFLFYILLCVALSLYETIDCSPPSLQPALQHHRSHEKAEALTNDIRKVSKSVT